TGGAGVAVALRLPAIRRRTAGLHRRAAGDVADPDRRRDPGPALSLPTGAGSSDRTDGLDDAAAATRHPRHRRDPRDARRLPMTVLEAAGAAPVLAAPPRPAQPLSTWQMLRTAGSNSLAIWDDAVFDELIVERRYLHQPVVIVSDPDGVRRVLVENFQNYR